MKLPYLGSYNPLLSQLGQRFGGNGHGRCPTTHPPKSPTASSRFQLPKAAPNLLTGDGWQVHPLQKANAALTYEAYLSNPDAPVHAGKCHPVERYTWRDHLQRLEQVEQDHRTHKRFSFTVLNTAETKCLGCVHLALLRPFLIRYNAPNHLLTAVGENAAMVSYWLCQPYRESHLPEQLVHAVHHWLTGDWQLADHFFQVSESDTGSVHSLAAAGLQVHFRLDVAVMPAPYLFYGG